MRSKSRYAVVSFHLHDQQMAVNSIKAVNDIYFTPRSREGALLFVVIYGSGSDREGNAQVDTQSASSFLKVVIRSRKDLESVYSALYSGNLESAHNG